MALSSCAGAALLLEDGLAAKRTTESPRTMLHNMLESSDSSPDGATPASAAHSLKAACNQPTAHYGYGDTSPFLSPCVSASPSRLINRSSSCYATASVPFQASMIAAAAGGAACLAQPCRTSCAGVPVGLTLCAEMAGWSGFDYTWFQMQAHLRALQQAPAGSDAVSGVHCTTDNAIAALRAARQHPAVAAKLQPQGCASAAPEQERPVPVAVTAALRSSSGGSSAIANWGEGIAPEASLAALPQIRSPKDSLHQERQRWLPRPSHDCRAQWWGKTSFFSDKRSKESALLW